MTINEFIYGVLEGLNISTDDFPVPKRWIYSQVKVTYQELVKQELNKYRLMDGDSAQVMECIELERVDAASCLDCDSGIYILRSKKPIPPLIESDYGIFFTVYLMNGKVIEYVPRWRWQSRKNKRNRLPNSEGFFISNDYLYVVDYDDVDELFVNGQGYFADPELVEVHNLQNPDCKDRCKPIFDLPFKCPAHIARRTIEIVRAVGRDKLQIPQDVDNNAKFNIDAKSQTQSNT